MLSYITLISYIKLGSVLICASFKDLLLYISGFKWTSARTICVHFNLFLLTE